MTTPLYQIPIKHLDGSQATLAEHRGQVLLIVNVASACGLTPQYAALEAIYDKYRDRGFAVLGFPCNDFGAQEPGSPAEIQAFCTTRFGVRFPLFEKITVKYEQRHPLYQHLIEAQPSASFMPQSDFRQRLAGYGIKAERESDILWNFEKFLVNRQGSVVARFAPDTPPDDPILVAAIEAQLQAHSK